MNCLRGLPLDLFFVNFGLALKRHYILKKFGKVRKLSGGPKGREERSNIRVREKKKKKKVMFETGRKKEKKLCSRQRGALPPPRHETNSQALNCQQSHSLYQSHVAVEEGKPLH